MGMSMHVVGYRPADDEWKRKKAVWDACKAAGVNLPKEVDDFFDSSDPGDSPGMEVALMGKGAERWDGNSSREGFQVDVEALPPGVRYVRFYCSW